MIFSTRTAANARRRTNRRASLTALESLEGRQLMTVAIPQFATVDLSHNNWQSTPIPSSKFAAMEDTTVTGIMPATQAATGTVYGDNFKVYLTKGQIDDITLDVSTNLGPINLPLDSSVSIYDPNGNQVTGAAKPFGESEVDFQASSAGWYYVSLHTDGNGLPLVGGVTPQYTAQVRPIGLDTTTDAALDPNHNAADAAKLDFTGGALYAVLNGRTAANANGGVTRTGTSVSFVGPTGRGFTIDGTWTESTNPTTWGITYTGSNLTLEMANPANPSSILRVPLSIGSATGLQVTMAPQTANDAQGLFGQVLGTQFTVGNVPFASQSGSNASISSAVSTLAGDFGQSADLSKYGASLTASNNLNWGIDLGDVASVQAGGMPANSAVPYLWFEADAGDQVSASFGNVSASIGSQYGVAAMIDPADPSFRLDISGLPNVGDLGLGGSLNGLIPYTPADSSLPTDPNLPGSTFYGDVYFKGGLDLAELTDEEVPVDLKGDVVLNLDPMHLGLDRVAGTLKGAFDTLLTGKPGSNFSASDVTNLMNDLEQTSVGLNGTASLSLSVEGIDVEAEIADGSLAWNGMDQNLSFAGGSVNPLAGTPISFLTAGSSVAASGSINLKTKAYGLDLDGDYGMFGQQLLNADINVSGNYGSASSFLATVTGSTDLNVSTGSMSTVGFTGDATNQVQFTVDGSGNGSFTANGNISVEGGVAGHTSTSSSSYSYSKSGNIVSILQAETTNIKTTFTSLGSKIESGLSSAYGSSSSAITNGWNKFKNWL